MIIWYVLLFVVAFVLGFLGVSPWITGITLYVGFFILLLNRNPLLLGKNTDKMMLYLKKSKQSYMKFLYYFFNEDFENAEKIVPKIMVKTYRNISEVMLLIKKHEYDEAKTILEAMRDSDMKWYYLAVIGLEERNYSAYKRYIAKMKNKMQITWLEAEEKRTYGQVDEAIKMIDEQIPKLRGIKLLSAVHYRKELERDLKRE